ncbi:MAG: metallophosphoesterase [Methanobacteriota archaeon]
MRCVFVSDLHGKPDRYKKLFAIALKEEPDAVFFGGDLLPNHLTVMNNMEEFIQKTLFSSMKKIKQKLGKPIRFFLILGNDDPRVYESLFETAHQNAILEYIHNKTCGFDTFFVVGYSFIPPTPFQLKDWEKYDVSRYVDVGAVSPEVGMRSVPVPLDDIRESTIVHDLDVLSKKVPVEKTIFLFHSPPYKSFLDRVDMDGIKIDHAPVDIHVGSVAIQRFITEKQPLLTLHGHVHESVRLTGQWKQKSGKSYMFSAAHDGPELAVVRFDTKKLENATRELV